MTQTTTFETECKKGVRACNRPECPVCNPQTTPPYLHRDLMEVPTHKLVDELLHRVKSDKDQMETHPHGFADLSLHWRLSHG